MIKSFRNKETRSLHEDEHVSQFASIERAARRKLEMLDAAENLNDLKSPPGNRLESLGGNRRGQFSIRINQQYRICFLWINNSAWEVEIVDYHRG